jgi:predicted transcriptional regulator
MYSFKTRVIEISEELRKYRSDTEILYGLLKVIVSAGARGIKKTHLMYRTNLNSKMLQRYMDILTEANVVVEEKRGKQKIVRLSPKGSIVYSSLEQLMTALFPQEEDEFTKFAKNEFKRFLKEGWDVSTETIVPGKSGLEYKPDVLLVKNGKRVLVKFILGQGDLGAVSQLVIFYSEVLDTGSTGLVVTDKPEIRNVIPEKLSEDVIVIDTRPLDTLYERVKEALEKI